MNKSMTVYYTVGDSLYVNLTNKCTNRCEFCIRKLGDGAYGSDSLWLEREPTVKEAVEGLLREDLKSYRELVFCGYGEPSFRLSLCRTLAILAKELCKDIKTRINTNGHSSLILGEDSLALYGGAFDTVSISLNRPTAEGYVETCHPVYGKDGFYAILDFAKNVKNYVQNVVLSVVGETLSEKEIAECQKIADTLGVSLKVRELIK